MLTRNHARTIPAAILLALIAPPAARAQIVGGSFGATGSDVVPRYFHAAGNLRTGEVMVSGGLGLQIFPPSLFSRNGIAFYRPSLGTFTTQFTPTGGGPPTTPVLLTARSAHTQTTLLDGRVLVTGGYINASGTSPGTPTATVELFDPVTGLMSAAAAMSAPRASHTATLLTTGAVVVAGNSTWQVFSPGDMWSTAFAMQRSRIEHAAVLLVNHAGMPGDHRVLLIGGNGTGPATMELLRPADGSSTLLASTLTVGVDDLAAIQLADGRVFIVGGQDVATGNTVAKAYVLDPVADVLTPLPDVPNRPNGLSDHEIARYGRYVCIFGGEEQLAGTDTELNYAAIFDAVTLTWLSNGTMNNVHDDFASVVLAPCGLLLIDGGVPLLGNEAPSVNCEVFTLTVAGACLLADVDNDGDADAADGAALAAVLVDQPLHPDHILRSDINADGRIDGRDAADWVAAVLP